MLIFVLVNGTLQYNESNKRFPAVDKTTNVCNFLYSLSLFLSLSLSLSLSLKLSLSLFLFLSQILCLPLLLNSEQNKWKQSNFKIKFNGNVTSFMVGSFMQLLTLFICLGPFSSFWLLYSLRFG